MGMITDIKGVQHIVEEHKAYTVLYRFADCDGKPKDTKVRFLTGLYINYPYDNHIGHDTEDGWHDPADDRVYFDDEVPLTRQRGKIILWIGTDEEWQNHLKEFVTNYIC